jgi:branched-chain amino acid transport system ATP-binding protein
MLNARAPAPVLPSTHRTLLEARDLEAWYGESHVLHGMSFTIPEGEVVTLLGRNGAGKTTTMRSIMGLLRKRRGSLVYDGTQTIGLAPNRIARLGIGYVPEDRRVFTELTVAENLSVAERPPRADAPLWTPERLFALFPNLAEMRRRPGNQMSGGEQQMLSIARTLMGNPDAILLDEPSEGLAPVIVQTMAEAVRAMKREGVAVLLSEQNWAFASAVADRACVIERGEIRFEGTVNALMADAALRADTLGV